MTVVHLIPQLRLGAGQYVVEFALRQVLDGARVMVVVSDDTEPPFVTDPALVRVLTDRGIAVHTGGDFFHRDLDGLNDAVSRARQLTADGPWIAHAHTAMAGAVARRAGAAAVVATCHGVAVGRPAAYDLQDALAWQFCDAVASPSRHWADRLASRFGVAAPHVIPVGLDLSAYPPIGRVAPASPASAAAPLRIVTMAEHTARKGLDVLIDAIAIHAARGTGVVCHLFGRGDATEALVDQARRLGLHGPNVVFEGHVARPYDRLGMFDLFVLSSRSDNQPVAAIEAMLAGLPIAVSDVGGLGDLARDGQCGWVVPPEDPRALADTIAEAAAGGAAARHARGRRGETFARTTFDVDATTRAWAAIYRRVSGTDAAA
jgi:glycosyltransferase involved in cell wall biosynthesis